MSLEKVKNYLSKFGLEKGVLEFEESSATVELAAKAIGTQPEKIAKTLSFMVKNAPILIVCAGNKKIDNSKFKEVFETKAKMLAFDEVEPLVGHRVGGVCPFAINEGVSVYLDESLRHFDKVYPACGSANSAIELTINQLETCAQNFAGFVDVCK